MGDLIALSCIKPCMTEYIYICMLNNLDNYNCNGSITFLKFWNFTMMFAFAKIQAWKKHNNWTVTIINIPVYSVRQQDNAPEVLKNEFHLRSGTMHRI